MARDRLALLVALVAGSSLVACASGADEPGVRAQPAHTAPLAKGRHEPPTGKPATTTEDASGWTSYAPQTPSAPACEAAGQWPDSHEAEWLGRVVATAGYDVAGCTGSALIVRAGRNSFFLWTTPAAGALAEEVIPAVLFEKLAGTPVYGDETRLVWRAQKLNVWLEPGPKAAERLPKRGTIAELVLITQRLPRRYERIKTMATPPGPLAECRSSPLLRRSCPTRVPAATGYAARLIERVGTYHTFNFARGAEYPEPEINRPPRMVHLVVEAASAHRDEPLLPFELANATPVQPRDGMVEFERAQGTWFERVRWGGRSGSLVLAPPYPLGGINGDHLIFTWREGKTEYAVGLHAWEPFTETAATLESVIESIPPRAAEPAPWENLRRPLHLPRIEAGQPCPTSPLARPTKKVAAALGTGPAYPVVGGQVAELEDDLVEQGWYWHKTLWAVAPRYRGQLLFRGGSVGGEGELRFGIDGQIRRELRITATTNSKWRFEPSHTLLRGPGCYAFQVDGKNLSKVIVFKAVLTAKAG